MILWKRLLLKVWIISLYFVKRKRFLIFTLLPLVLLVLLIGTVYIYLDLLQTSPDEWRPKYLNVNKNHFLQNNEQICSSHRNGTRDSPFLITIIHSARHHFEYRTRIRETWGSVSNYKNWTIRKVFILGVNYLNILSSNQTIINNEINTRRLIAEESTKYGDIIVANFSDSYRNMTYKHLMGYKWVLNYCQHATFVLKTDDDIFVDTFQLVNYLNTKIYVQQQSSNILCHKWEDAPKRFVLDKWRISREEFADDAYPLFCIGAAYITTPTIMKNIYALHNQVRYFWIDDIFVTGVLRDRYNKRGSTDLDSPDTIGIEDIQSMYELNEKYISYQNSKIFYLLKRLGGMNFYGMEVYWSLAVVEESKRSQLVVSRATWMSLQFHNVLPVCFLLYTYLSVH